MNLTRTTGERLRAAAFGIAAAGLLAAALTALLAGCSVKKAMVPNLPPETTVFVQGDVDTVNHVVRLYWFGTDPDGTVTDFEIRLLNPSAPDDTLWTPTTTAGVLRTDSLFVVYVPDGFAEPVFEVRAVDDDGERDPTPARQTFKFSNQAPTVRLVNVPGLNDTTFASVTLTWVPTDPDGDLLKMKYRVWLDGNEANPVITTATTFTIPTDQFRVAGRLTSGRRTAYVQAIDDGGRASAAVSTQWYVRAPVTGTRARLLIVDDVPTSNIANIRSDTLFSNAVARAGLSADQYTILRLQSLQPFRSSKDVEQTFGLFEAVVWYRGNQTIATGPFPQYWTLMRDYQDGFGAYLDNGGHLFIEGLELIDALNARGAFSEAFAERYLAVDGFFVQFSATIGDSTAGWGDRTNNRFVSSFGDTLGITSAPVSGIRAFQVRDPADIFVYAPALELGGANPIPMPIAMNVSQASGGRFIMVTFPLAFANRAPYDNAARLVSRVYDLLGLTGP